jgi:large subunit ribosomal protein L10
MALTKQAKHDLVDEVSQLLADSKLTVVAKYEGTTVKALQGLRRDARSNGTKVKVVKNRLVIKAIQANEGLKDVDTALLQGMLLYAFNSEDEVAPAQSLHDFAKANPTLEFVGAITAEGKFMGADEVKALATLPSKPQLIASVIATLQSPLNDITNGLAGNLHGLLDAVAAKAA